MTLPKIIKKKYHMAFRYENGKSQVQKGHSSKFKKTFKY